MNAKVLGSNKPAYSWSWFLETDDSYLLLKAIEIGVSEDYLKLTSDYMKEVDKNIEDI